jgi:hypothetical protein
MKKFNSNKLKKIIQIGAWMRNIEAINKLDLGNNTIQLHKYTLKGKKMDDYYHDSENNNENIINNKDIIDIIGNNNEDDFENNVDSSDNSTDNLSMINSDDNRESFSKNEDNAAKNRESISKNGECVSVSRDRKSRQFKINNDVKLITYLENNDYDELLNKNIVFINLIGASAVNTVIECIVRNTPIIVNRLPALVEVLGEKYPLFYDNIHDVRNLLKKKTIEAGHNHIKNLNKDKFRIEHFTKHFLQIVESL